MAQNRIPDKLSELFSFANQMADGLGLLGALLGIVHNDEAAVRADLFTAETAWNLYNQARASKVVLTTAQSTADAQGKAFIATARNVIASFLGSEWTQVWEPTGFPNQSTAIPSTIAERQTLLHSLGLYFTAFPTQEVAALNVTAARANTLFDDLSDARAMVNAGLTLIGQRMAVRQTTEPALRKRLSDVISELAMKLGPLDPRWETFGLNRPGADSTADIADAPTLTSIGPGVVFADWPDAARADHYFVEKQVVGTDPNFVQVANAPESESLLQGLPSGATVRIRIIAA
ncbi:MAG: hypothetical protein H7062_13490, partial [Candidatus Saccharimonas sp.]|nr:hypothetical protein [Planctomycetaceae bacterium]